MVERTLLVPAVATLFGIVHAAFDSTRGVTLRYRGPVTGEWSSRLSGVARRHPVITGVLVGCTLLGAALGPVLLTEDWSLLRRVFAGGFAGAGIGLLVTATRMLD